MGKTSCDAILKKIEKIEEYLEKIEKNGRVNEEEVWHIRRSEIDGKTVEVKIRCNIISVGEIDNVNQQFKAEIWMGATYREPSLAGKTREDVDWEEEWDPRIVFVNAVSMDKYKTKHILEYEPNDPIPIVKIGMRVIGTFKEKLELGSFPFDSQELSIRIMSDWPITDVQFVQDDSIKNSIRRDTFTASHNWTLKDHVLAEVINSEKENSGSHRVYPIYQIGCHVVRKPGYYFWNVSLITGLIMLLTFASLAVSPAETADRLSVTLTLLLTSVAFKFVVSQSLPQISYLTYLDIYVLFCMIFQCVMVVQNSVASVLVNGEDFSRARLFDWICALVLLFCLVSFHVIMGSIVFFGVRKRNKHLERIKKAYDEECAVINERWQQKKRSQGMKKAPPGQPPVSNNRVSTKISPHPNQLPQLEKKVPDTNFSVKKPQSSSESSSNGSESSDTDSSVQVVVGEQPGRKYRKINAPQI